MNTTRIRHCATEGCTSALPGASAKSRRYCDDCRERRRVARNHLRTLAKNRREWEARHRGESYTTYLAMRAAGVCNVCGKTYNELHQLCADDDGTEIHGVVCARHISDLRAVRDHLASPLEPLASYIQRSAA